MNEFVSFATEHFENGCVSFHGMGDNGQPLYIKQWKMCVKNLQLKKVLNSGKVSKQNIPQNIKDGIEFYVEQLKQFDHENLINFTNVVCFLDENFLTVYLIRDQSIGLTSLSKYLTLTKCTLRCCKSIVTSIIQALSYIHSSGITHGNINFESIFIDDSKNWKTSDYFIVPYLNYLIADLPVNDYVSIEFNENSCVSAPSNLVANDYKLVANLLNSIDLKPSNKLEDFIKQLPGCEPMLLIKHSFLKDDESLEDYEFVCRLGQGSFGTVLKMKCKTDKMTYAIKRVDLGTNTTRRSSRANTDVAALSRLQHDHVVRYFHSWTDVVDEPSYYTFGRTLSELADDDMEGKGNT